jgi:hypothetical protein
MRVARYGTDYNSLDELPVSVVVALLVCSHRGAVVVGNFGSCGMTESEGDLDEENSLFCAIS